MKKESALKRAAQTIEGRNYLYTLVLSLVASIVVSLISKGGPIMYAALLLSFVSYYATNKFIKIMNYFTAQDNKEKNV